MDYLITIGIPTLNREEILLNTIRDCLSQSVRNLEVFVADQSPAHSDRFNQELSKLQKDSRLNYKLLTPASVTAAKNYILKNCKTDLVIFIDDDVKLKKDFAKAHLDCHEKNKTLSAVGGRVMQKGFPILDKILKFDDLAVSHGVFTSPKSGYTNAFAGGNVSMKVEDALKMGGFDTRYYLNAFREESDMSMKMTNAGLKVYFEPKAELLHLAAPSGGSRNKTYNDIRDTAMFYRNELFFTLRYAKQKRAALSYKKKEYCDVPDTKIRRRRICLFYLGILAAIWRMLSSHQIIAKELI